MKQLLRSLMVLGLCSCAATTGSWFGAQKVVLMGVGASCCNVEHTADGYNLLCGAGVKVIQASNFIVTDEKCER